MATSESSNFTQNTTQIITRALRQCSAIAPEDTNNIPQTMIDTSQQALNSMVKEWDATGIHLWTESEGVLFPQPFQTQYSLGTTDVGPALTDHAAEFWLYGKLTTPIIGGSAAYTPFTVGPFNYNGQRTVNPTDQLGIVLNNGFVFWTTVNASQMFFDPTATPYFAGLDTGIPIAPELLVNTPIDIPISAIIQADDIIPFSANPGNFVFVYSQSNALVRPLRIPSSRRSLLATPAPIDTPMLVYSRLDYRELPNKLTPGTPTAFFYDPQIDLFGQYYLWPTPPDVSAVYRFTWYRQIQDFDSAIDNPDLPQEWINALTWNLAVEIAPEFDVPLPKYQILTARAARSLDTVQGWDREPESVYFGVAFTPSSR